MSSTQFPSSPEQCLVVTFGGICLDYLAVLSTFPKPDDKTRCRSMKIQGGGDAANTATCLARLGVRARLISKLADDIHGKSLIEELTDDGVDTSFLVVAKDGQTPFSYVLVDQSTRTRTCIFTETPLMEPVDVSPGLKSALEGAKFVYFDARYTDTAIVVAQEAAKQNIPILLDAEKKRSGLDDLLDFSDYVVCSAKFPQAWTEAPSLPSALISMLHKLPKLKFAIVTLGEHGCLMLERSSEEKPLMEEEDADSLWRSLKQDKDDSKTKPTCYSSEVVKLKANGIQPLTGRLFVCTAERIPPSELVDTTGAGDAFIGAILYALCVNMPTEDMLPFAATVAAAGCKELGARTGLPSATHPHLARFLGQTDNSAKSNEEFPSHIDQITSNSQNTSNVNMVLPPVGTEGVAAPGNPGIDIIRVLHEALVNFTGQNQVAPSTAATAAAAPEVQPRNVIGEPAVASGSWFRSNRDGNRFGKKPMIEKKYHIRPNRNDRIEKPALNLNGVCRICRRKHGPTLCPDRTGACYGCGQHDHKVRTCPYKFRGVQAPPPHYRRGHY